MVGVDAGGRPNPLLAAYRTASVREALPDPPAEAPARSLLALAHTTVPVDEADALADAITVIDHGRVIAHDSPDGLKRVIGGQRIRAVPSDHHRIDEVARILAETAGRASERTGRFEVTVAVDDDAALGAVVRRLDDAAIRVSELSLHLPSLDEVFMTLTGHRTTDDAGEAAA